MTLVHRTTAIRCRRSLLFRQPLLMELILGMLFAVTRINHGHGVNPCIHTCANVCSVRTPPINALCVHVCVEREAPDSNEKTSPAVTIHRGNTHDKPNHWKHF